MKTTAAQFEIFKKEAKKWQKKLGLLDWYLDFFHEDWSKESGCAIAWCNWHLKAHSAALCFSTKTHYTKKQLTTHMIKGIAFHEICHLLTAHIQYMAELYVDADVVEARVHELIQRLLNCVFEGER